MTSKSDPAKRVVPVTPSDATVFAPPLRALWVGTPGAVAITDPAGTSATFLNVSGLLPVECSKVLSTGTTASDIVGLR